MNLLEVFTQDDLIAALGVETVAKGLGYVSRVSALSTEGNTVSALVKGRQRTPYTVEAAVEEESGLADGLPILTSSMHLSDGLRLQARGGDDAGVAAPAPPPRPPARAGAGLGEGFSRGCGQRRERRRAQAQVGRRPPTRCATSSSPACTAGDYQRHLLQGPPRPARRDPPARAPGATSSARCRPRPPSSTTPTSTSCACCGHTARVATSTRATACRSRGATATS